MYWSAVYTFFTRRGHIWSFKRCLERIYDLNVTMQHKGSIRVISSNTYTLYSGGLLEIRCEYDCQHDHKGGYWTCGIRFIRILESLTAWRILLRTVGQIWAFLNVYLLRWWSNTYKVGTQQRRRWLATFDTAIHNRYKYRRYLLGYLLLFQFRI